MRSRYIPVEHLTVPQLIAAAEQRERVVLTNGVEAQLVSWPKERQVQLVKINLGGQYKRIPTDQVRSLKRADA